MKNSTSPAEQFIEAYNMKSLSEMTALLCPDATAEVVDSGWPVEKSPETIAKTSFPHILEDADEVIAELFVEDRKTFVLFRMRKGDRPLESAIQVFERDGLISRIEYLVRPQAPDKVQALADRVGIEVEPLN